MGWAMSVNFKCRVAVSISQISDGQELHHRTMPIDFETNKIKILLQERVENKIKTGS